jgi:hypothetical protein
MMSLLAVGNRREFDDVDNRAFGWARHLLVSQQANVDGVIGQHVDHRRVLSQSDRQFVDNVMRLVETAPDKHSDKFQERLFSSPLTTS